MEVKPREATDALASDEVNQQVMISKEIPRAATPQRHPNDMAITQPGPPRDYQRLAPPARPSGQKREPWKRETRFSAPEMPMLAEENP